MIKIKFPLQPHQKSNITQYREHGFHSLLGWKDDHTTHSHFLTYTFLFKKVGRMCFLNLGVKGLKFVLSFLQPPKTKGCNSWKDPYGWDKEQIKGNAGESRSGENNIEGRSGANSKWFAEPHSGAIRVGWLVRLLLYMWDESSEERLHCACTTTCLAARVRIGVHRCGTALVVAVEAGEWLLLIFASAQEALFDVPSQM